MVFQCLPPPLRYSSSDTSWYVHSDSGFSAAWVGELTNEGVHAAKPSRTYVSSRYSWWEVGTWSTTWSSELFSNGGGFSTSTGRYTAKSSAAYLITNNLRFDNNANGYQYWIRSIIAFNNYISTGNGMSVFDYPSYQYESYTNTGNIILKAGDVVYQKVYTYDSRVDVQAESGFSVAKLPAFASEVQFHVDLCSHQYKGRGWFKIAGWCSPSSTANLKQSNAGNHFNVATGEFTAPYDGLYLVTSNIQLYSACRSLMRLSMFVNGKVDTNNGLTYMDAQSDCNKRYTRMPVNGYIKLAKDDTLAVWVYSTSDNSWTAYSEAGWGVSLISI